MTTAVIQANRNFTAPILATLILAIFVILGINGGLPTEDQRPAFFLGLLSLILMTLLSGSVAWYLLLRPLPAWHKVSELPILSASQRQILVVVLGVATIFLTVGAIWDEIWHRIYGLPFGEDFFWRPHLMLYAGFATVILGAVAGWYVILFRGRGTLQQRFRSDPIVGIVTLMGSFLLYSLPVDPLWHTIYGADISAWSIPHIVLAMSFASIAIMVAIVQSSLLSQREWASLRHAEARDAILIFILSFVLTPLLLLLTSEWDSLRLPLTATSYLQVLERPDWMLPSFLGFCSVFVAVLSNHVTRRWGSGTLAVLIALLVRLSLISYFGAEDITARMWLLSLPPAIAVDLYYGVMVSHNRQLLTWWMSAIAGAVAMIVVGYPLINQLLIEPQVSLSNLPVWIITTTLATLMASWMGQAIGDYASTANKLTTVTLATQRVRLFAPAAFLATLLFVAWAMVTAIPPI